MPYEDFTTYTKSGNGCWSVTTNQCNAASLPRTDTGYYYKDYGNGYFANFKHKLDICITSVVNTAFQGLWFLNNSPCNWANSAAYNLVLYAYGISTSQYDLQFGYNDHNNDTQTGSTTLNVGTTYYLRLERYGNVITCKIYSTAALRDAGNTPDIDTQTFNNADCNKAQEYLECGFGRDRSGTAAISGYCQNLDLSGGTHTHTASDILGLLDSKNKYKHAYKTEGDKIGLLDAKTKLKNMSRTVTDKIGLNDSWNRVKYIYRVFLDKVGLLDSKSKHGQRSRSISDKLGLLEGKLKHKSMSRSISDKLGLLDTKSKLKHMSRAVSDKLGLKDSWSRVKHIYRIFQEELGLKDAKSKFRSRWHTVSDYLGMLEAKITYKARHQYRTVSDYLGLLESKSKSKHAIKSISDKLGLLDVRYKAKHVYKTVADILAIKSPQLGGSSTSTHSVNWQLMMEGSEQDDWDIALSNPYIATLDDLMTVVSEQQWLGIYAKDSNGNNIWSIDYLDNGNAICNIYYNNGQNFYQGSITCSNGHVVVTVDNNGITFTGTSSFSHSVPFTSVAEIVTINDDGNFNGGQLDINITMGIASWGLQKFVHRFRTYTDMLGLVESKSKHKTISKIINEYLGIADRILAIPLYTKRSKYWDREHPLQRVKVNP